MFESKKWLGLMIGNFWLYFGYFIDKIIQNIWDVNYF